MKVDISKEDELLFLIDTGADISLLKGNKLIGTTEYDPENKEKVKCLDGSPMETHGVLEARIELSNSSIYTTFSWQTRTRAKVCYELRTVTLNGEIYKMVDRAKQLEAREPNMRKIGQIKLPPRAESIVRVPVTSGSPLVRMTNKCKIQGVILAASLTKVVDGYVMRSILNTNDTEGVIGY